MHVNDGEKEKLYWPYTLYDIILVKSAGNRTHM